MTSKDFPTTCRLRLCLVAALAALAVLSSAQTPRYSVRNLGTLIKSTETDRVGAMSSDGTKVVGSLYYLSGNSYVYKSFYWDGTMHDMGTNSLPGLSGISVTPTGLVLSNDASVWTLAGGKVMLPFTATTGGRRYAYAMNDAGVVAGFCDNPDQPLGSNPDGTPRYASIGVRWARDVTGQWTFMQLPPLAGHNSSKAYSGATPTFGANSIDQSGNIVGVSWFTSLDANGNVIITDAHVALWSPSDGFAAHDLGAVPSTNGWLIDSRTDAVTLETRFIWNYGGNPNPLAFYSDPTTASTTELLGFGASFPVARALGVNVLGQVAGVANFASGEHAFYWDTTFPSGAVMDLGVLSGTGSSGFGPDNRPGNPINDGGFIVGSSNYATIAILSTPASRATSAKLLNLNALLSNTLSSVALTSLTNGYSVNNAGFILCLANSVKVQGNIYQRVAILTRVQ